MVLRGGRPFSSPPPTPPPYAKTWSFSQKNVLRNIMEFLDHLMQIIILQNMNILRLLPPSLLLLQTGNRGNDKIRQFYVANIPCLYKLAFITILRLSEDVIYMKEGNFVRKSISQQFGLRYRRVNKINHMFA